MDSLSFQVSCAAWIVGTGLYQVIGIPALSLTVLELPRFEQHPVFLDFGGQFLPAINVAVLVNSWMVLRT